MIGYGELIIILCVVLLLFGGKKLPDFAKNLGKGIREFKKACQGMDEEENLSLPQDQKNDKVKKILDNCDEHE